MPSWPSLLPSLFKSIEERASAFIRRASAAIYGGTDNQRQDHEDHQVYLKSRVLAVSPEEQGREGQAQGHSGRRAWAKFRSYYSRLESQQFNTLYKSGAGAAQRIETSFKPGGASGPPKEALNTSPNKAFDRAAPDAATSGKSETDPLSEHPTLYLLVKIELSLIAALVPTASFLVSVAPKPFGDPIIGTPAAPSSIAVSDGYTFEKEKLLPGASVYYRQPGMYPPGQSQGAYSGQEIYYGTITSARPGQQPQDPWILQVLRPNGQRDGHDRLLTSAQIVYLQKPSMPFLSQQVLAGMEAAANTGSEHGHGSGMGDESDVGGMDTDHADAPTGCASAHMAILLKYCTNEIVNTRLIAPDGKCSKATSIGHSHTTTNTILDLQRFTGQLSWLLYNTCRHHLLAMRYNIHSGPMIVNQLDELRDILMGGESCASGSGKGYLHYWFNITSIRLLQQNPSMLQSMGHCGMGSNHELMQEEVHRFSDWEDYRKWLLGEIAACKVTMMVQSVDGGQVVAGQTAPRRPRKRMEVETI